MLLEKIEELLKEVNALTAQNAEEVEQLRIKYLSKKGEINALMADFRNVPGDQKKEVGIKINELKNAALEKINGLKEQMEEAESSSDDIDLTRTAYPVALGTRHLILHHGQWMAGSERYRISCTGQVDVIA